MGPGVLSPCFMLLWVGVWALPAGSLSPPELSKAGATRMFKDFLIRFNRTYKSPEEQRRRFGIFTRNLLAAQGLQETELGTARYGVTRLSDRTDAELQGRFPSPPPRSVRRARRLRMGEVPESCDWRKAGAVTAVRNQRSRNCGSCWAFAAVSNIESLWNIHFHQPRNLSVQEVLDCSWCGAVCRGSNVCDAFTTVLQNRGLTSEAAYPYKGKKMKCQRQHKPVVYIQGFEILPGDEEEMAAYVATLGPITVTLNSAAMKHYKKGISKPSKSQCRSDQVNHVALLVGYAAENNIPYWIIKNSWGEDWGEKGYYRLFRGANACGITTFPITATIDRPGAPGRKVHCPR